MLAKVLGCIQGLGQRQWRSSVLTDISDLGDENFVSLPCGVTVVPSASALVVLQEP